MNPLIFLIGIVLIGAVNSNASLFTIGIIILFSYTIYSMQKNDSIVKISKPTNANVFETLDKIKVKNPEGMVDEMLTDFAKVTKAAVKGKSNVNVKSVLKGAHNLVNDTLKPFEENFK